MAMATRWWGWAIAAAVSLLLLAAGMLLLRDKIVAPDLESWRRYQATARARGEDLGMEAWLPPVVANEDDVFAHPWMLGFLSGGDSPEAKAVEAMQAWPGLGSDDSEAGAENHQSGKSWFDDKPSERDRVLEAGRMQAGNLAAIREMAARSGGRLRMDVTNSHQSIFGDLPDFPLLGDILALHASAALAAGDEESAVADLEALLRLGSHFRRQNLKLLQSVGARLEASALPVIEAAAIGKAFSPASKQRLRAARRSRNIEDELTATWKGERGLFILSLDSFLRTSRPGGSNALSAFFHPPERLLAINSLAYCEMLDRVLTPPGSLAKWREFDQWIELVPETEGYNLAQLAHTSFLLAGDTVDILLAKEEEIERIFRLLDP